MLQMRPNCECCNSDLGPAAEAWICSFECTFCTHCAHETLAGRCPNCGGDFTRRPTRVGAMLAKHPASTQRVVKEHGCVAAG